MRLFVENRISFKLCARNPSYGDCMSQPELPQVAGAKESRAFFAALLAACRSNCDCQTCEILRSVADGMTKEFGGGAGSGSRKRK